MDCRLKIVSLCGFLAFTFASANALPSPFPADEHSPIVIVYKDGHRQSLAGSEVQRIEIKAPAAIVYKDGHRDKISGEIERIEFSDFDLNSKAPGRTHFIGKWEVGQGNGAHFFITLQADGRARKTLGSPHGTWTLLDGEARITWDDGWHDVIRKVDGKHEKRAYEPGKSYDDPPANITPARNIQAKPI